MSKWVYMSHERDCGTCAIELMPLNAVVMAIQNHHGDWEDFYFAPTRIEVDRDNGQCVTLLRGALGGYSQSGYNAEVGIKLGTLVKWEMQKCSD